MDSLTEIENKLQEQEQRIKTLEQIICPEGHDYQRSNTFTEKIINFAQGRQEIDVQHFICSRCNKRITRFIQTKEY